MNNSEIIVFNSFVLYAKLLFTIGVNLIATRLILNAMGVEDYGIVNLISGIVAMLSFLQNSMAVSTQRYMSVNMGKHDKQLQRKLFNNGLALHILFSIIILIILEACIPLVFISNIQIPVERNSASMVLYQLTCLGTILVIVGVPLDALLNAHENMLWVSFASILESIIRLIGAVLLQYSNSDKLVVYGILIVVVRLASLLLKALYCRNKYSEVKFIKDDISKEQMKEMLSFSFWNMFGSFAVAVRSQGVAVVLNIFNGVIVNTSYGIGNQVSGQLANFSGTISKSMSPQIMQREGSGDFSAMVSLALKQCRYTTLFVFMFALPLYIEMPYVLHLWLKNIPDYSIDFCRVFLLIAIVSQMSSGLMTAIQAKGQIVAYEIIISVLLIINIPISFFLQMKGYSPSTVLWGMFVVEIACLIARVILARNLVGIYVLDYIYQVLFKLSMVIVPTVLIIFFCKIFIITPFSLSFQLIFIVFLTIILIIFLTYLVFDKNERELVVKLVRKTKSNIKI